MVDERARAHAHDHAEAAEGTAVRVALWRAMHVQVDPPPHVLEDEVGLRLAAPDDGLAPTARTWTRTAHGWFRAGIVARARFVEDLVAEQAEHGVGCSTSFLAPGSTPSPSGGPSWRRVSGSSRSTNPAPRPGSAGVSSSWVSVSRSGCAWCRSTSRRAVVVGAAGRRWLRSRPARRRRLHRCDSMYLTKEANAATLRQIARLAPGSTLAMTFLVPTELLDDVLRPGFEAAAARCAGSRDALHQLLHAGRNAGARPPGWISHGPARLVGCTQRALFRRAERRVPDGRR